MGRLKIMNSPSIRRMPTYLHKLFAMRQEGRVHVSTTELAEYMNIEPIVVRKDIALTGISGRRRVGYDINELIDFIHNYLGWTRKTRAVLVGAGSLGSAILGFDDFELYGLEIEAVYDSDPEKIGSSTRGYEIFDIESVESKMAADPPDMVILCVSKLAAQQVADRMIALGVRYIWNFANVCLRVPKNVVVQREVLAGGFAMLAAKMKFIRSGNARDALPGED